MSQKVKMHQQWRLVNYWSDVRCSNRCKLKHQKFIANLVVRFGFLKAWYDISDISPVVTMTSILFFVNFLIILVEIISISIGCFSTWHSSEAPNAPSQFDIFMVGQQLVQTLTFTVFRTDKCVKSLNWAR